MLNIGMCLDPYEWFSLKLGILLDMTKLYCFTPV